MAYIKTNEAGRIIAARYNEPCGAESIEVSFPNEVTPSNAYDYLYQKGEFIYSPIMKKDLEPTLDFRVEKAEADIEYLAMMAGIDMEA